MGTKIVIVGGVAAGPKAACRVKRLMQDAEVTIIDQDTLFPMVVVVFLIMFQEMFPMRQSCVPPASIWFETKIFFTMPRVLLLKVVPEPWL